MYVQNVNCFSLWYSKNTYLIYYLKADVLDVSGKKLEYPAKNSRCHAFYLLLDDGLSASATDCHDISEYMTKFSFISPTRRRVRRRAPPRARAD